VGGAVGPFAAERWWVVLLSPTVTAGLSALACALAAAPLLWLTGAAVLLTALGLGGLRRRDFG
jgi:putative exporter of polyketide antibiotics